MDFLGTSGVDALTFLGLAAASLVTSFLGVFTGAAGGVMLLGIMALAMPPAVLLPVHTVVMLGSGITRTMIMWRDVIRGTVLPFLIGAIVGAIAGANVFIALPQSMLLLILGVFMLIVTWLPKLGRIGGERNRFAVLGFFTTFLGVFVSATGSLLAPFLASHTPNRYKMVATMGALMTITHIAKLLAFGFIGFAIGSYLPLMAVMIVTGAVGNWFGEVALHKTSEQRFRLILQLILTALALRLIWNAGVQAGWV